MKFKYKLIAVGGTFDLLHIGHAALIKKAFKLGQKVSIGITTDKFCQDSGKIPFENEKLRYKNLRLFLKKNKTLKRARISWLNDIFGEAIKDKTVEAIVVTKETVNNAVEINKKRKSRRLKVLKIIQVPFVKAYDGKQTSATRIKNGEINREGKSYFQILQKIAGERLNEKIRSKLKKPFSKIKHQSLLNKGKIITIGDISTSTTIKAKKLPNLAVVDFLVHREKKFSSLQELGYANNNPDLIVKNTPGQISKELIGAIDKCLKNKTKGQVILVDGEEDLAFIPALLLAPLGYKVLYGQPNKGLVAVDVIPEAKDKLCSLLNLN